MAIPETVELRVEEAGAGWRARVNSPGGECKSIELQWDGRPPEVLDGLAAAVLPWAMRHGGRLRVHGPMTRGALRGLTEFGNAWARWAPKSLSRVELLADEIRVGRPAVGSGALVAWSGSLASTHTVVRHLDRDGAGSLGIAGVLRIVGLRRGDDAGLDEARRAAESVGKPLIVARTNAGEIGLIDPIIGRLPMVAAALHAAGAGYSCGLHARGWLMEAHRRFPQPGLALPDLLGGDELAVRGDGGFVAPSVQAGEVARYPAFLAAMRETVGRRGRSERAMVALALGAGGAPQRATIGQVLALRMGDSIVAADAEATAGHWMGGGWGARTALRGRVAGRQVANVMRDYARWMQAALRVRPLWPR